MLSRFAVLVVAALHCGHALAKPPAAKKIVEHIDRLYHADATEADVTMNIKNPEWERTLKLKIWRRGKDDTLVRILSPQKDAGVATLRNKTAIWNVFPKIAKVINVPPVMLASPWMGTDFTYDDLLQQTTFSDAYNVAELQEEKDVYVVMLTPKRQSSIPWSKVKLTVHRKTLLPLNSVYYDAAGYAVRRAVFTNVRTFNGRVLPATIDIVPLARDGQKTTVTYDRLRQGETTSAQHFSLSSLQSRF